MPEITTTSNPNIPPQIPKPGNVASLANSSTLSNLKNSTPPKAFGDQLKNMAVATAVTAVTSILSRLLKQKTDLIQEEIKLDTNHQKKIAEINKQYPSRENEDIKNEYEKAIATENANYEAEKKIIQTQKSQNQKSIDDIQKDPFAKQKEEKNKRKNAQSKAKSRTRAEKQKSKKNRAKSVLQNAKKSLVPILTLLLTNKIAEIVAGNDKIKKLVNDTNAIIAEANATQDPAKLNNAKIARDNAIKVIQSNEDKIIKINKQISQISIYINIFSLLVSIISAIPIPTAVPPGIGIPVNLIMRLVKILQKANDILLALSALIPIISSALDKAVSILEDYKTQLLTINGELDVAAATGINSSLLGNNQYGTLLGEYKGFKFALREENNPKFVVRGNKRHYAVAIDSNNVEVLKSDSSFTLDPNDLIEQLKLVIDNKNLYTGTSNNPQPENSDNDVQNFMKVNSPENINALINKTQQSQQSQASQATAIQQQQIQAVATQTVLTTRPALTNQQKSYYLQVYLDTNKPLYERNNAKAILDRNYI